MPANIKLKRSAVGGRQPQASDLEYGEIALNYADGKLFYKNSSNVVSSISGGGATTDVTAPSTGLSDGALWWDAENGKLKIYYEDADTSQWVDVIQSGKGYTGSAGAISYDETAPANPSDGQIWYDTRTGKSYIYYNVAGNANWILFADPTVTDGDIGYTGSKGYTGSRGTISPRGISLITPQVSDERTILYSDTALELDEIRAVLVGGSSVGFDIKTATTRSSAGSTVATATASSTGAGDILTISSSSISAGSYIWIEVTSVSGIVDELHVNLIFSE